MTQNGLSMRGKWSLARRKLRYTDENEANLEPVAIAVKKYEHRAYHRDHFEGLHLTAKDHDGNQP